jgi:cell division septation protein DedD
MAKGLSRVSARPSCLWLIAVVLLAAAGCAAPAEKVEEKPKPPPLEELRSQVQELQRRQEALRRKRAALEEDFASLSREISELESLRQEVVAAQREAQERAAAMRQVEAEALEPEAAPKPPRVLPPRPGGPGREPYVVHTASYRTRRQALQGASRWAKEGYLAYTARAELGPKGTWYRILIDRFPSVGEARSFARQLKRLHKIRYAAPMKLPYSVDLEAYATMDEVRQARSELERQGIYPYVVEEVGPDGSTFYRLRVGAYKTRREAEAAARQAARAGAESAVVTP